MVGTWACGDEGVPFEPKVPVEGDTEFTSSVATDGTGASPGASAGAGYEANVGERAFELFDNTVTVIDTLAPDAPTRLDREMPIWGCQSLEVSGDTAYCAAGQRGVEVIDLSSMR